MVPMINCLLHKHEDLGSIPGTHLKKGGHGHKHRAGGGQRLADPWDAKAGQHRLLGELWGTERPCLNSNNNNNKDSY